jgi:hypothetical protein
MSNPIASIASPCNSTLQNTFLLKLMLSSSDARLAVEDIILPLPTPCSGRCSPNFPKNGKFFEVDRPNTPTRGIPRPTEVIETDNPPIGETAEDEEEDPKALLHDGKNEDDVKHFLIMTKLKRRVPVSSKRDTKNPCGGNYRVQ